MKAGNFARLVVGESAAWSRYLCTASTPVAGSNSKRRKSEESAWFRRLRGINVADGRTKLGCTIDRWIAGGAEIEKFDVSGWIHRLRQIQMYPHALEVSKWMEKKRWMNNVDQAMHIDLLSKTKEGLAKAEKYFNGLQTSEKTAETFGALLSCYCRKKMPEKAMDLLEKMKDFGITPSAWHMNHLLTLHLKVGQPEKVPLLVQLMEDFGYAPDLYTYNHLMNSYADLKDYNGVETVLKKMLDGEVKPNWRTYGTLARIYINAGFLSKAAEALENIEKNTLHDPEAFNTLISLYGKINDLSGVYRAWESLKSMPISIIQDCYLSILITLSKLGDVDGLEKCFSQWKASHSKEDMRLYDVILKSYLDRDMLLEAESLSEKLVKKQVKPTFNTLSLYMNFHLKKGQTDIALKYLEQGAAKLKEWRYNDWFPDEKTVVLFLKSFEDKKDDVISHKFYEIMKCLNRESPPPTPAQP